MVAVWQLFQKEDRIEVTVQEVWQEMKWVTKSLGLSDFRESDIRDHLVFMESYGLLLLKERKKGLAILPKVDIGVISSTYGDHQTLKRFF